MTSQSVIIVTRVTWEGESESTKVIGAFSDDEKANKFIKSKDDPDDKYYSEEFNKSLGYQ